MLNRGGLRYHRPSFPGSFTTIPNIWFVTSWSTSADRSKPEPEAGTEHKRKPELISVFQGFVEMSSSSEALKAARDLDQGPVSVSGSRLVGSVSRKYPRLVNGSGTASLPVPPPSCQLSAVTDLRSVSAGRTLTKTRMRTSPAGHGAGPPDFITPVARLDRRRPGIVAPNRVQRYLETVQRRISKRLRDRNLPPGEKPGPEGVQRLIQLKEKELLRTR